MAFRILPSALQDIRSISVHIAKDNPRAAKKWVVTVKEKCRRIGRTPGLGTGRAEIDPTLRVVAVGKYLILYRMSGPDVEIVRVLHGARDWQSLLRV